MHIKKAKIGMNFCLGCFGPLLPLTEMNRYDPGESVSYNFTCAPSEDSDQPAHPHRLIRIFAGLRHLGSLGTLKPTKWHVKTLISLRGLSLWGRLCDIEGNAVSWLKAYMYQV